MKQKDMYTFEELCDSLKIPMSEFCRKAEITEGTLARIRKGYPARRSTANKILDAFSRIYGLDFDLNNVSGLYSLKPVATTMTLESPDLEKPIDDTLARKSPQNRIVERKKAEIPEDLPEGVVTHYEFAKRHGVNPRTFSDQIMKGVRGEKVDAIVREKPNRPNETDKYLTPDQQQAALDFWRRHHFKFTE